MSRPTNLPDSVPRRLLRGLTGRCTPLGDRNLTTAEERRRNDQMKEMQAALEEQGIRDHKVSDRDLTNNGGNSSIPNSRSLDSTQIRRGVYVHDARNHWLDPLHRSERQNPATERRGLEGDVEYDASVDHYVGSPQLAAASRTCGFTDSERLALRSLASTPQPGADRYYSSSRARSRSGAETPQPSVHTGNNNNNNNSRRNSTSSSLQEHPSQQSKTFAEVYHGRLKAIEEATSPTSSSAAAAATFGNRLPPLGEPRSPAGLMHSHIADATANFFGQRHAPSASQARTHAPRDSAASVLHGHATNAAGHHPIYHDHDTVQKAHQRKQTRALTWKQERQEREHFIEDRRERVNEKQRAVVDTKISRAASRSVGPYDRDADSFYRREGRRGVAIVYSSPARSTKSRLGNWLFDYPTKQQQQQH